MSRNTREVVLSAGKTYFIQTPSISRQEFKGGDSGALRVPDEDNFCFIFDDQNKIAFRWTRSGQSPPGRRERVVLHDMENHKTLVKVITITGNLDKPSTKGGDGDKANPKETPEKNQSEEPEERSSAEPKPDVNKPEAVVGKTEAVPPNGDVSNVKTNEIGNSNGNSTDNPVKSEPPKTSSSSSKVKPEEESRKRTAPDAPEPIPNKRLATTPTSKKDTSSSSSAYEQQRSTRPVTHPPDICRYQTYNIYDVYDHILTADGGYLVLYGGYGNTIIQTGWMGTVQVNGNLQSLSLPGVGNGTVNGNVEEGVYLRGTGNVNIYGNVRGGIQLNGVGDVTVHGDVYGDIYTSGVGSVTVCGSHRNGYIYRSGIGGVRVLSGYHNYK